MKSVIIYFYFVLYTTCLFAQQNAVIKGTIKDSKTGEALLGVNVIANSIGATTDLDGNFKIELTEGEYKLQVSYLGYESISQKVSLKEGETKILDFNLRESAKQLDLVTVSGSKYERKLSEETVSIEVLKNGLLQNSNVITLNEGMDKIAGVVIVDNQATIRGGSGYSFGVGSRVQLMIDDMPTLSVDRSEIRWNSVPMELIDQVEVLKSASSALYGASALNGVVSVRTGFAKDKPETEALIYTQFYDGPKREESNWWKDNPINYPLRYGGHISHKQRFGQHDVSLAANYNKTVGFIRLNDFGHRRFTAKYRFRPKKIEGLTTGLSVNMMDSEEADYFFWNGYTTQAYIPFGSGGANDKGTISLQKRRTVMLDPWVKYNDKFGNAHVFRNRYYYANLLFTSSGPVAHQIFSEYQFQRKFKFGLNMILGGIMQLSYLDDPTEFGNRQNQNFAPYVQLDYKIGRLNVVGGFRYEMYKLDSITANRPVATAGLNFQAAQSSWFRLNFSQGFRFPSLAERFAEEALTDQVKVLPNPDLLPEYGFNAEFGFKQGLKINNWLGYADVSFFWMEYWNMIEFLFGYFPPAVIPPDKKPGDYLGFRAENISRARIAGYEVTLVGSGKVGKIPVRLQSGYTYNYGADLNADTTLANAGKFMKYFFNSVGTNYNELKTANDSIVAAAMLKYRFRHLVKFDAEFDLGKVTFGSEVRYYSFVEKVDAVFELFIPELQSYRANNPKGSVVYNQRISYDFSKFGKISFIVNNVANREFSIRPARLEAPRNFTIQYKITI
jgi:iron complex outermembrane receptor protein